MVLTSVEAKLSLEDVKGLEIKVLKLPDQINDT